MRNGRFILLYLVLVAAQTLLCNFLNLSHYLTLSVLPMLIVCLPVGCGAVAGMIVAFATGFAVDFFSDGMLGLTILALVPVAVARIGLVRLVCGQELFARGENVTLRRQGIPKMALLLLMANIIFFVVYIIADGAGTFGAGLTVLRILLSCIVSTAVQLWLTAPLTSE